MHPAIHPHEGKGKNGRMQEWMVCVCVCVCAYLLCVDVCVFVCCAVLFVHVNVCLTCITLSSCSNLNRLRSLIQPSLISPWTKLIGVQTIGLPAVITLKFHLNPPEGSIYFKVGAVLT